MKIYFKNILIITFLILFVTTLKADEGMWLPLSIKDTKFREMQKDGLKLSAKEIYSINNHCLTNAVVGIMSEGSNLRSYCSGSFISEDGLIITNYHSILKWIESFSTQKRDFIKHGYWSSSNGEETFCRGLEVKQLVRMVDITNDILKGTENLSGNELQNRINKNGIEIAKRLTAGTKLEARTSVFFGGAQYIMSLYNVFKDVRMVAAPPISIGKFGGDEYNFSWPRRVGDFAILRVYADKNNNPANYSKLNIPYKPTSYLRVSNNGIKENDFAMIIGFPGKTREYIPSFALERILEDKLIQRDFSKRKMELVKNALAKNTEAKFRYTTRLSSIGNTYTKLKGEVLGIESSNIIKDKETEEINFNKWIESSPWNISHYGNILNEIEKQYKILSYYNRANLYFAEVALNSTELIPFIGKFEKLVAMYDRAELKASKSRDSSLDKYLDKRSIQNECKRLIGLTNLFLGGWYPELDRELFRDAFIKYYSESATEFKEPIMNKLVIKYHGDIEYMTKDLFSKSMFTNRDSLLYFLADSCRDIKAKIKEDDLYKLAISFYRINVNKIARQRQKLQIGQAELLRIYYNALIEYHNEKKILLYPDANSTLRISFGKIKGMVPESGIIYTPITYTDHLKDRVPANFLTTAHTTSGSSGSPVINKNGEFIGINFDRVWTGLASDYVYSIDKCRSIAVDARYILYLLKKHKECKYILNSIDSSYVND